MLNKRKVLVKICKFIGKNHSTGTKNIVKKQSLVKKNIKMDIEKIVQPPLVGVFLASGPLVLLHR
jgi:hypothetical protein